MARMERAEDHRDGYAFGINPIFLFFISGFLCGVFPLELNRISSSMRNMRLLL